MNREMADKIIEIIKEDATGRTRMFSENGEMCVLGGLWAAYTGKTCEELYRRYTNLDNDEPEPYAEVVEAYGLTSQQKYDLYTTNDNYEILYERRAALIELVESWV